MNGFSEADPMAQSVLTSDFLAFTNWPKHAKNKQNNKYDLCV